MRYKLIVTIYILSVYVIDISSWGIRTVLPEGCALGWPVGCEEGWPDGRPKRVDSILQCIHILKITYSNKWYGTSFILHIYILSVYVIDISSWGISTVLPEGCALGCPVGCEEGWPDGRPERVIRYYNAFTYSKAHFIMNDEIQVNCYYIYFISLCHRYKQLRY